MGTFVLDRIVGLSRGDGPEERLGGIAYALAAAAAALPEGWRLLPVARLGEDAASDVRPWLADTGLDGSAVLEVPETNNRVELRYRGRQDRTERLSGGVGSWSWDELAPRVARCHALLVNFISGHEMGLDDTRRLREDVSGPLYADLHSLFLATEEDGRRVPRRLPRWREWVACFDAVQMNADELDRMRGPMDVEAAVRSALDLGPALVVCTQGERGAVAWSRTGASRRFSGGRRRVGPGDGTVRRHQIAPRPVPAPDPTGCGDVFGGTVCARLLAGDSVEEALALATRLASVAADTSGADRLPEVLERAVQDEMSHGPKEKGGER